MDQKQFRCVFRTCRCNKYRKAVGAQERLCDCSHDRDCHNFVTEEEIEERRRDVDSEIVGCLSHGCNCVDFVKDPSPFVMGCYECKHSQSEHRPQTREDKSHLAKIRRSSRQACVQQCECVGFAAKPGSKFQSTACANCPHPLLDHRKLSKPELLLRQQLERAKDLRCRGRRVAERTDDYYAGDEKTRPKSEEDQADLEGGGEGYEDVVVKTAYPERCVCSGFTGPHWTSLWRQMEGESAEVGDEIAEVECKCGHLFSEHREPGEDGESDCEGDTLEETSTMAASRFVVVHQTQIDVSVEPTLAMKHTSDKKKDTIIFTAVDDRSILFWCMEEGTEEGAEEGVEKGEAAGRLSDEEEDTSDKENQNGVQRGRVLRRTRARVKTVIEESVRVVAEDFKGEFRDKEVNLPASLFANNRTPLLTSWHPRRDQLLVASTGESEGVENDNDDGARRVSLPVTVYDHGTGRLVPGGIWAGDEVGRRGGSVCSIAWHPTIPVFALGLSDGRVLLHTSQLFVADDIPPALRDEFEELIEEGDDDEWSGMWTRRAPLACVESRGSMKGGGRIREATCVEFSRDGTLLATGYVDGIITVSSIRIHKRDKYVTRADEMQIMRVWESSIDFGAVMSLCWDAKCRFLAAGSEDDAVTIFYNPTTPPSPPSPTSSSPPAQRSPLATTGNRMTKSPKMAKRKSAEDDGKKRNKKVKGAVGAAGEQKDTLLKFFNPMPISTTTTGPTSSSSLTAASVLFTCKTALRQHTSFVCSLCLHPRGRWLFSAGYDGVVCVWNVEAVLYGEWARGKGKDDDGGAKVREDKEEGKDDDGGARVEEDKEKTEVETIKAARKVKLTTDPIESIALSPDGSHLFAKIYKTQRTAGYGNITLSRHEVMVCSVPSDMDLGNGFSHHL